MRSVQATNGAPSPGGVAPLLSAGVVRCATGMCVALRGVARTGPDVLLRVVEAAAVVPPDRQPIEARRSDRVVWRRHWSAPERLVVEFVGIALVEVADATGEVVFDRRLADDIEEHLLLDHVLPLVLARRGNLVLHAGVVSLHGKGAVLVGSSGAGKSTLCAYAWQHGWALGGDDGAVLFTDDPPTCEPTYATVRLSPGSLDLLGLDPAACSPVAGKMRLAGDDHVFRQERMEARLVAIVEPGAPGGMSRFERLSGVDAHVELLSSTFDVDKRQLGAVVDRLGSIVESTIVGRLTVARSIHGLAAAEELMRALVCGDSGSSGGGAGDEDSGSVEGP